MKCWASSVSECCTIQSREHYLTKGLFEGKMLLVKNAPFLGGKTQEISKASLTKKCLCKKHNELLSIYDDEAILFARSLEYAASLSLKRRNSKETRFSVHRKNIDLENFSRWYIKTYLGFYEFFKYPTMLDESFLAGLVFSNSKISKFLKLEINMAENEDLSIEQVVSISPLELNGLTCGMLIEFFGFRLTGVFSDSPNNPKANLKIKFNDHRQGLSCLVTIK